VYVRGSGDALDHWYVSDRVNYHSSPAIRAAGHAALTQAGHDISQVDVFDLYSCFPCAPQIAAAMLGIAADDPRPLTVTGGLPYAGGPGNNYSTHAIAAMVSRLRAHPGRVGMVTGVGWYLTKHAVGIYSATPPDGVRTRVPLREYQMTIDAMEHPTCVTEAEGEGHVETYTVLHDRDGTPETGVIVGRLGNGSRFWANTPADRALLDVMEQREMIGCRGRVRHEPSAGVNRFEPDVAS
jgi:acetyl-CoA C-acetyltransferase